MVCGKSESLGGSRTLLFLDWNHSDMEEISLWWVPTASTTTVQGNAPLQRNYSKLWLVLWPFCETVGFKLKCQQYIVAQVCTPALTRPFCVFASFPCVCRFPLISPSTKNMDNRQGWMRVFVSTTAGQQIEIDPWLQSEATCLGEASTFFFFFYSRAHFIQSRFRPRH